MDSLFARPDEMNFDAANLAATWKKWKQTMSLYLTAAMHGKSELERYSTFLYIIGERGREIFNNMEWQKKTNEEGIVTDEDDITVQGLFQKFETYCLPKKNLIIERRRFFMRNQQHDESIDAYLTQLRNLASTCDFETIKEGMLVYKLVDGIQSDKVRDNLLRKGTDLTLYKAMDICRAEETTKQELKTIKKEKEVDRVKKQHTNYSAIDKKKQYNNKLKPQHNNKKGSKCNYCGRMHAPKACPAYDHICRLCKRKNHWACCCKSKGIEIATASTSTASSDYLIEEINSQETSLNEKDGNCSKDKFKKSIC